jgi:peptidoglycan/LPS O-acetylase OafA/YrhL
VVLDVVNSKCSDDATGTAPAATAVKTRIAFIDVGRAVAAVLVLFTHVNILFLGEHFPGNAFSAAVTGLLGTPLQLGEQALGALAVPFFFLVSGFVVTPIALRMGARRFGVNRLLRVYPPLVFVVLLSAGAILLGLRPLISGKQPEVTVTTVVNNSLLLNFLQKPFGAFVGVAWTLVIELIFYAMLVALLPLLRRWMWPAIAVELTLVLIVILTHAWFGDSYRVFASEMAHLIVPIMGQVIWAWWARKIPGWLAAGFLAVGWEIFVWAANLRMDSDYVLRPLPIAFAVVLFLTGSGIEPRLRQHRLWTALSERSYSLYLVHGAVALPVMHSLVDVLPLWLTLVTGLVATGVMVEVSYRLVERPSHDLARRLSRRRTTAARDATSTHRVA